MHCSDSYKVIDNQNDFIVVSKLPGIAVQGVGDGLSLIALVKKDLNLEALYPVHRLDVPTSGLVVMAKTTVANKTLSLAFKNREIDKYYLAITHKKPSKKQGQVIGDMEKSRGGSYKLLRTKNNPAQTSFFSFGLGDGKRLIVLKPKSGKTHQLRVALKSLSAPIVGDERYGGIIADRMYLHAYQLRFVFDGQVFSYLSLPETGDVFQSNVFLECLGKIGNLQDLFWP